jgi:ectoine hydroxylase-related dioxygenase (phytanoyl-CoA dioxygenase family)
LITVAPELNTDVAAFEREGYVVVQGLLTRAEADAASAAFEDVKATAVSGQRGSANERVLVRHASLLDVVTKPALHAVLAAIFGDDLQLLAYDSLETPPHAGALRDWHADFGFRAAETLTANVGVYLQDMTDEVGPLYVVPGSHRCDTGPTPEQRHEPVEGEVKAAVSAGDAVVFDAQIWHTGSRNDSDRPRRAVFPYFGRWWLKRMDAYYETPLPETITGPDADPVLRQLFGLRAPASASVHGADYRADNARWR